MSPFYDTIKDGVVTIEITKFINSKAVPYYNFFVIFWPSPPPSARHLNLVKYSYHILGKVLGVINDSGPPLVLNDYFKRQSDTLSLRRHIRILQVVQAEYARVFPVHLFCPPHFVMCRTRHLGEI